MSNINISSNYTEIIPKEFRDNPKSYFENYGVNIKSGEKIIDGQGKVREDPTAVKYFPNWQDNNRNVKSIVAKKVNTEKGKIRKSGDPFYEAKIMQYIKKQNIYHLQVSDVIAKVEQDGEYFIVMERITGRTWTEILSNYSESQILSITKQTKQIIEQLKQKYSNIGIVRNFDLKDMIFKIDEKGNVSDIIPTDWEKTKLIPEIAIPILDKIKKQTTHEEPCI